ncbi:MAG TPA: 16S rRNA (adenine(1518)-N(6)/adenine(1519)-N(6))-dimethyltransferase RsmA [Candidatus Cybelea sp.]|jgi:16S rRNA (adenine1518-N6/adenine1519-N6)-dimethyltransferase|nr:16S rRNA (adenine(1518)-N(6)/adenine(1519)-N(6))-dimethyltransferase RsmA [Candidatus Cybelea sp.]
MLAQAGIRPKKRFGQNFLVNPSIAQRIARFALEDATPELRVIEIGAGTGELTRALLEQHAAVTALEIDPDLVALLRAREDLRGAKIVEADALTFGFSDWAGAHRWRVAGNLPYNIATPLLLRLIEMEGGPEQLIVMVQRDVAQRFAAKAGTAAYGSLSVAIQYAMAVQPLLRVAPQSFYPAPKVDSSLIRLVRRPQPAVAVRDLDRFWKVVRGAFAYRRKTLVNSLALALGVDRGLITRALSSCNLSTEIRGERLDLGDFARLADALAGE